MNKDECLSKMISPGMKRPGKPRGGVIQIHVTRACNLACFNCTQGSNLRGKAPFISLDHFEQACASLEHYFGIVGVFGGNPALHPQFPELCQILANYIPFERRGLWCNNLNGHGAICRKTFNPAVSNLNVHLDAEAFKEMRRDWPEARPFGLQEDSRHSPVHLAMKDVVEDEETRWDLISKCDINIHWSSMICVFRNELRAFFCEIAGAQAMLHQNEPEYPDTGIKVTPDWWKQTMQDFEGQVVKHCHECAVPLRGYGELSQSQNGAEMTSKTHADVYLPKKKERPVHIAVSLEDMKANALQKTTDYVGNGRK